MRQESTSAPRAASGPGGDPARGPVTLGRHWLVECMEIPSSKLDDVGALEALFVGAARAAGATVLGASFHRFEPQGVSGVVLLAESHLTVHTWPEHRYAAVDLFSCSEHIRIEPVIEVLRGGLGGGEFRVAAALSRGVVERAPRSADGQEPELSWRARHEALAPSAMSLSVDVEGCSPGILEEGVSALVALLPAALRDHREPPVVRRHGGETTVFWSFDGGHLTAVLVPPEGTLRVDVFSRGFVDPVTLALQIRQRFEGRHHALSCAFRR